MTWRELRNNSNSNNQNNSPDKLTAQYLMDKAGLNRNQANSATAKAIIDLYKDGDMSATLIEAQREVESLRTAKQEIENEILKCQTVANETLEEIKKITSVLDDISERGLKDTKAKDALIFYSLLLKTGLDYDKKQSIINAGYAVYAYLGGGARQVIPVSREEKDDQYKYWRD